MKHSYNNFLSLVKSFILLLTVPLLITACGEDDPGVTPTGNEKTYTLYSVSDPSINGTVVFKEMSDNSTNIEISLNGTTDGNLHPAHIHNNTAVEGGGIAVSLGEVDGGNGMSSINITETDDGTAITYTELLEFDGYVNVHLSSGELGTLVAQGDIGQNELTGTMIEYTLNEANTSGVSGSAKFEERANGEALATVTLTGTTGGGAHPNHIHNNSVATGGGIALSLNDVDGTTGIGKTNISELDDATAFGYSDVLTFNGHINIHLSNQDFSVVANGDIGSNAN